ncbi:hypothetical protein Lalb_Chr24g0394431 [Lupinus albus]|uniref:Uncharacterized protein n=1 Tax=Lupinus albus TaxID=3870 RepID=A0A6A4MPJ5_LUPAL|nr:hypothetical protein Lalb_Chr24g0394431 [Lupinus albus]
MYSTRTLLHHSLFDYHLPCVSWFLYTCILILQIKKQNTKEYSTEQVSLTYTQPGACVRG